MAAQFAYDSAKSQWLQAAKDAQSQKDEARTAYEKDKSYGITEDSFSEWVHQGRYPAFNAAYSNYQQAEGAYTAAWENLDSSACQQWQHKKHQDLRPIMMKGGEESHFIIYTDAE